ncbi:hypothetical protein ACWD5V_15510 [Streptomyces sp. NPDC002523]
MGRLVGVAHCGLFLPCSRSRLGCMKKSVSYSEGLGANQKTNINTVY